MCVLVLCPVKDFFFNILAQEKVLIISTQARIKRMGEGYPMSGPFGPHLRNALKRRPTTRSAHPLAGKCSTRSWNLVPPNKAKRKQTKPYETEGKQTGIWGLSAECIVLRMAGIRRTRWIDSWLSMALLAFLALRNEGKWQENREEKRQQRVAAIVDVLRRPVSSTHLTRINSLRSSGKNNNRKGDFWWPLSAGSTPFCWPPIG